MNSATDMDRIVRYRRTQLRRRTITGVRGGRRYLWQAAEANPVWGYWYQTATQAATDSNASDKIIRS